MATGLESIRVLQDAEEVADELWKEVIKWDSFARDVVGGQLQRAIDSIGANIAEAFGRYHYGEKLQFLYYARGSLFESKYWLNRSNTRGLLKSTRVEWYVNQLNSVARQLNAFAGKIKSQRYGKHDQPKQVRESEVTYTIRLIDKLPLFSQTELDWLSGIGD